MNQPKRLSANQSFLSIQLPEVMTFDNFYAGSNHTAIAALQDLLCQYDQNNRFILLWGEANVGKTHCLKASCAAANLSNQTQLLLPCKQLSHFTPDILTGLEQIDCICIDDLHGIAGNRAWQEAFFHFYNRFLTSRARLIITSVKPPADVQIDLADLRSRLSSASTFHLKALTDEDKILALQRQASIQGMTLPHTVADYILHRSNRDMQSLMQIIRQLDAASLQAKRPLTIPFVKATLGY